MSAIEPENHDAIIAATREWVEKAVIGLNLCPFAKAVQVKGQVRYVVSAARTEADLLAELERELQFLRATAPEVVDNTLLIHPYVLEDFYAFAEFLPHADDALRKAGFEGEIQLASFHPQYQFADAEADDITNFTNRSPFPTLHLLREASVAAAVEGLPAAERIYETNLETMRELGPEGWAKLGIKPTGGPVDDNGRANPEKK